MGGFQLQASSPCIDAGVEIENNGGRDHGQSLCDKRPDIGSHEYQRHFSLQHVLNEETKMTLNTN